MITFERKYIGNKRYYYLTEQVRVGKKYKKIQVFVGKNIPSVKQAFFAKLKAKEKALYTNDFCAHVYQGKTLDGLIIRSIEHTRIDWKYHIAQLSEAAQAQQMRRFAICFIYESNAIEGSKLSQAEVSAIVRKQYVKKNIPQREVQEALNSIEAFEYIQTPAFKLNQKTIKHLHKIVTDGLGMPTGFKTQKIIVNNKQTTPPEKVRKELSPLLSWYKQSKKREHPFVRAMIFHNDFERIHPFTDGNGSVGRLILNWMLLKDGYGVLLFRNGNRRAYMSALDKGDKGRHRNILKLSRHTYQKTIRDFVGGQE